MGEDEGGKERPIFRDIRRYYCDYCGLCRSKKSLITSHIIAYHQEMVNEESCDRDQKMDGLQSNTCEECGASFKKPSYLKQHMQSHSLERPFICSVDDCHASYRRKDHLSRHVLQHQGKLFTCSIESCNCKFTVQSNMKRHVKKFHVEDSSSSDVKGQKQYICQEAGCGKIFKYKSKLRRHEESHVKLESVEAFCSESGCMKYFTNKEYLETHIRSCHQHISCEICGSRQLRKNIKRHIRTHEGSNSRERTKCSFKGCHLSFSTKSNLRQHEKAVHHEIRRFACSLCDKRFAYKHVRDNHEKSGVHVYTLGDFVTADEEFRSRPRGGRKRKFPTVEMLTRKRVNALTSTGSCLVYED